MTVKVLYIPVPVLLHPWYDDFVAAVDGRHPVELFDVSRPWEQQFRGVDVVVELGGSVATREMIDTGVAAGVKLWQFSGTGLDHVDVAYFLEKGMVLTHTPGPFSAIALAEHALFLMLFLAKDFRASQRSLAGRVIALPTSEELAGKTLAIIGLGASGRELAKRSWAMEMRVTAIDVADVAKAVRDELHIDFFGNSSQMDRVLAEADYVSLHTPLTSKTRHMIGGRAFELMKPTASLINVARGELVDEDALLEALQAGRIKGAGLDVFAQEPLDPAHPLLKMDNVIVTPHVAGATTGTSRRRGQALADNLERFARDLPLLYQVTSAE